MGMESMRNPSRQTMKMNIFLIITIQLFVICSVFASPTEENHTNSIHKTFHSHQNEIPQMRNKEEKSNIKQEHDIKNSDNPSTPPLKVKLIILMYDNCVYNFYCKVLFCSNKYSYSDQK